MDDPDTLKFDSLMMELSSGEEGIPKSMSPFRFIFDEQPVKIDLGSLSDSIPSAFIQDEDGFDGELLQEESQLIDPVDTVYIDLNIVSDKENFENNLGQAIDISFIDKCSADSESNCDASLEFDVGGVNLEECDSAEAVQVTNDSNTSVVNKVVDTSKVTKKSNRFRQLMCEICDKVFSSKGNMRLHKVKKHGVEMPFVCQVCNQKFSLCRELVAHRNAEHRRSDGMFECAECGKAVLEYHNFTLHLKRHAKHRTENEKSVRCNQCGKMVSSIKMLRVHWSHVHSTSSSAISVEEIFSCSICNITFTSREELSSHLLKHRIGSIFQCAECDKFFLKEAHLKVHLRLHDGVGHFQCSKCNQEYYLLEDLKKHKRQKHPRKKTYTCGDCGIEFSKSREFRTHRRIHTGVKLHECKVCGKTFTRSSDVIRHMRVHTGEEPYECDICEKRFKQSGLLNSHVKKFHPEVNDVDYIFSELL